MNVFHGLTAGEEACSDASDAETHGTCSSLCLVVHARPTLPIEHASLVSASAGSLAAQPLSCWVTR